MAQQQVVRHSRPKICTSKEFTSFEDNKDGSIIGTHSVQKFASTHVRRSGCSHDDLNVHGR